MTYINDTLQIPKFSGTIWYVSQASGNDSNSGRLPTNAFATIGKAITSMAAGDAINVKAGTYTETGLTLAANGCEIWFEIGAILQPATGTALTISGSYCKVVCQDGAVVIDPAEADATAVLASGHFVYLKNIRAKCDSVAGIGFDITGNGCVLRDCRCANPLTAAFKIQGNSAQLLDCCTGGETADTSIGFWMTNTCDKARLKNCGSQGHATSGYQVDTGCTNGVIEGCYSGGGDGRWTDADLSFVWSNFSYDDEVDKVVALDGSTAYDIFTVTGAIRISDLYAIVETIIANTSSTAKIVAYSTNASVDITDAPGVNIQAAPVGSLMIRNGPIADPLVLVKPSSTPAVEENASYRDPKTVFDVLKDNAAATTIRLVLSDAVASGQFRFHCHWEPLSKAGFLAPA